LRNIAVGLGNASGSQEILNQLIKKINHPSELVREHVNWAIERQKEKLNIA
jgi:epoxyqueuosine reductase